MINSNLSVSTKFFDLITLTVSFDLHFEKFNIDHNFWTITGRAFILLTWLLYIPCDETFLSVPNCFTLTLIFDLHFENFNIDHNFKLYEVVLSYFTCVFLVARPDPQYQNFWPCDCGLCPSFWDLIRPWKRVTTILWICLFFYIRFARFYVCI